MLRSILTSIIVIVVLTNMSYCQDDSTYVSGQALIRTIQPFNAIDIIGGKVITGEAWFDALSAKFGITNLTKVFRSNRPIFATYYKVEFSLLTDVNAVCSDFLSQPEVVFAKPNHVYTAASEYMPNDSLYGNQWALVKISAPQAWEVTTGDSTVVIGITDSGTDIGWPYHPAPHPDLADNLWRDSLESYGYNVFDPFLPPYDNCGHGTHCAGIAGAIANNGIGVCGIAGGWGNQRGCKIMTVKCLDSLAGSYEDVVSEAVRWASDPDDDPFTKDGARIISMSWGCRDYPYSQQTLQNAIGYAHDSCGCVLVACAHNFNMSLKSPAKWIYPACWDSCIAVAATDRYDKKAVYSVYGKDVDVAAPGGFRMVIKEDGVLSTTPTYPAFSLHYTRDYDLCYEYMNGTSMATPYVSGLAGLILSRWPTLTNQQVRERILGTADNVNFMQHQDRHDSIGTGRINAFKAVTMDSQPVFILSDAKVSTSAGFIRAINIGYNDLYIRARNIWLNASNAFALLRTNDHLVTIIQPTINLGYVGKYAFVENSGSPFQFTVSDTCPLGRDVKFYIDFSSDGHVSTDSFELKVQPKQVNGFPAYLGGSIKGSANAADIDGDGYNELVVGSTNDTLYTVKKDGTVLWKYGTGGEIHTVPAIGDIDNDGRLDIAIASRDGYLYIIDNGGYYKWSYYIGNTGGNTGHRFSQPSPVMYDIDNDDKLEVVSIKGSSSVVALSGNGVLKWETQLGAYPTFASPAMLKSNGLDAYVIVLVGQSDGKIYSISGQNGSIAWSNNLSTSLPEPTRDLSMSPLVGDINNDSKSEIICMGDYTGSGAKSEGCEYKIYVYNDNGQLLWCTARENRSTMSSPVLADINQDAALEIICVDRDGFCTIYTASGQILTEAAVADTFSSSPAIGAVDRFLDKYKITAGSFCNVYMINGDLASNYPLYTVGRLYDSPAITDIDNNGKADVIIGDDAGYLYMWSSNDAYIQYEWPAFRHDQWNTGNYHAGRPLTSLTTTATAFNNGRKLARQPNTNIVWTAYESAGKVFATRSADGGKTYGLPMMLGYGFGPALALDKDGYPNMVWMNMEEQDNFILYYERLGQGSSPISIYVQSSYSSPPAIAVNGESIVYIIWPDKDVIKAANFPVGNPGGIVIEDVFEGMGDFPSVATDLLNKPHAVFQGADGDIYYIYNNGNNWTRPECISE